MFVWIENTPTLENNSEEEIVQFVDQYLICNADNEETANHVTLQTHKQEARKGNLGLKKQVRHIGNVFSNCVEVSAQEAVYLGLQIPLTKCTRDIVFNNTSTPEERIFLLKPKAVLDELPEMI